MTPESQFSFSFQPPPSQDSPKKIMESKGPAPNPPLSGEAQLKYENDRLKLALAQRYAKDLINLVIFSILLTTADLVPVKFTTLIPYNTRSFLTKTLVSVIVKAF